MPALCAHIGSQPSLIKMSVVFLICSVCNRACCCILRVREESVHINHNNQTSSCFLMLESVKCKIVYIYIYCGEALILENTPERKKVINIATGIYSCSIY